MRMRSLAGFVGALFLLLGVAVAFAAGVAFGDGAEAIIHFALGVSFLLFARAAFDFGLPGWIKVAACAAIGALAVVFMLQGVSDVARSPQLATLAYDVLGQRLEKGLGYAFLAWCVCVGFVERSRVLQVFGGVVLAAVAGFEIYSFSLEMRGGAAAPVWKFIYLPVFVWLAAVSRARRSP